MKDMRFMKRLFKIKHERFDRGNFSITENIVETLRYSILNYMMYCR